MSPIFTSLIDSNNTSFRSKVLAKFTLKINRVNINKNKSSKSTDLPITSNKLSSSILAKLPKEISEILKYFKKNNQFNKKKEQKKSYTQALTSANTMRKVLKIKETFSDLQVKKIENIQKIINSKGKTKPRLYMTTKGLSRKQVTVLISNDNKTKFMADLSTHIVNRALKNIKSEVKANLIQLDQAEIIITTNKVAA